MTEQVRDPEPTVMRLALLPTGEAVRPADVKRIRIEPEPPLLEQELERYAVVIVLADEGPWVVRDGLSLDEATSLSRRCCQAINDSLKPES
jgi:hypothetical protein